MKRSFQSIRHPGATFFKATCLLFVTGFVLGEHFVAVGDDVVVRKWVRMWGSPSDDGGWYGDIALSPDGVFIVDSTDGSFDGEVNPGGQRSIDIPYQAQSRWRAAVEQDLGFGRRGCWRGCMCGFMG